MAEGWCEDIHYLSHLPECVSQSSLQWDHSMTDLFRQRLAWAGGLGKLMNNDFETWLCIFGHPCLFQLLNPPSHSMGGSSMGMGSGSVVGSGAPRDTPPPGSNVTGDTPLNVTSDTPLNVTGDTPLPGSGFVPGDTPQPSFEIPRLVSEDECRPDTDWMCFVYSEERKQFCPWYTFPSWPKGRTPFLDLLPHFKLKDREQSDRAL